jgi:hypothetical protein
MAGRGYIPIRGKGRDWMTIWTISRRALVQAGLGAGLCAGLGVAAAQDVSPFLSGREGSGVVDHQAFDELIARRVSLGGDGVVRVDYAGWNASAQDRAALKAYVQALQAVDPAALTRAEQFAFWANLYNALTIDVVLEAWPVASIREIDAGLFSSGPWKRKVATVNGAALTLDNIEHDILRPGWKDARVHYAVNCASFSCPNLPLKAWRGATLEQDLNDAAAAYVNHPRGATFDGEDLVVSSIYSWYQSDFGGGEAGVITHLSIYAAAPLKEKLLKVSAIDRDVYDWSINAIQNG